MKTGRLKSKTNLFAGATLLTAIALAAPVSVSAEDQEPMQETFDGLSLVEGAKLATAYIDTEADLGVYNKVMILDCHVAFKKGWDKKTRAGTRIRISGSDMDRIKADVAALFRDVFTERLSSDGGYEIVTEAGADVLLVRPAIIDLDITAPDDMSGGRSRVYTTSSGAATLYIELYDSVTGDILARAADRQGARKASGHMSYSNRVTNRADARRMLGGWADLLRAKLDEFHGK
jgi:hypothetical protein